MKTKLKKRPLKRLREVPEPKNNLESLRALSTAFAWASPRTKILVMICLAFIMTIIVLALTSNTDSAQRFEKFRMKPQHTSESLFPKSLQ